jgi:hypothetical protein
MLSEAADDESDFEFLRAVALEWRGLTGKPMPELPTWQEHWCVPWEEVRQL